VGGAADAISCVQWCERCRSRGDPHAARLLVRRLQDEPQSLCRMLAASALRSQAPTCSPVSCCASLATQGGFPERWQRITTTSSRPGRVSTRYAIAVVPSSPAATTDEAAVHAQSVKAASTRSQKFFVMVAHASDRPDRCPCRTRVWRLRRKVGYVARPTFASTRRARDSIGPSIRRHRSWMR